MPLTAAASAVGSSDVLGTVSSASPLHSLHPEHANDPPSSFGYRIEGREKIPILPSSRACIEWKTLLSFIASQSQLDGGRSSLRLCMVAALSDSECKTPAPQRDSGAIDIDIVEESTEPVFFVA